MPPKEGTASEAPIVTTHAREESAAQTASASSNGDADAKKTPSDNNIIADDISESSNGSTPSGSHSGGGRRGGGTKDDAELTATELAQREILSLMRTRLIVGTLFLLSSAAAAIAAYFLTTREQEEDLEYYYTDVAEQVLSNAHQVLSTVFTLMATTTTTMTALTNNATQWPYVTFSNYPVTSSAFLESTGAQLLSWSPLIMGELERVSWGRYSTTHDEWVQQGLEYQSFQDGTDNMPNGPYNVPAEIYRRNDQGEAVVETGSGPFVPVWQMANAPNQSWVVNFNLLSNPEFDLAYQEVSSSANQAVFTDLIDASLLYGDSVQTSSPQNLAIMPLYGTPLSAPSMERQDMDQVGVLVSVLSWDMYFAMGTTTDEDSIPNNAPIYAVVSNGQCGKVFTYELDGTQKVTFMGYQDSHDTHYDAYEVSMTFWSGDMDATIYSTCPWTISIYPSASLVNTFETKAPVLWTVFIALVFFITGIVFFVYDIFVQKRQIKVMSSAAKNNAIVSSLFPAEVRDRLFGKDGSGGGGGTNKKGGGATGGDATNNNQEGGGQYPESTKFRLKHYLSEDELAGGGNGISGKDAATADEDSEEGNVGTGNAANGTGTGTGTGGTSNVVVPRIEGLDMHETKPIADLFPNTTVMFADIAGFTAWSSVREPSQVFTLLETVYRAFDGIAKRRRVFKVETVGDCYVAVAGLPEPRKDHAVVMAKFARECLDKFNSLAKQLEITLGPDTADLAMRAGLHSGPVTAGVLRGDKSRFQLFGDTVNTAARIEHTGQRNRVHLSADTAQLLMDAGKEHWCRKRTDIVSAKGKGDMQTFWLQSPGDTTSPEEEKEPETAGGLQQRLRDVTLDELEAALPPKIQRLVGWNVEILKKLLQGIIAQRNAKGNKRNYDHQITKLEAEYCKRKYCLDEVTEIIALPKFDIKAHKNMENPNKIELPKDVVDQLRLYVSSVAAMHRESNPFHNFEHASHVTMSVSKLLARIVAPDEVMNQEEGEDNIAASLHDHTYGITSDPLTHFGCVLSALIHDTDHMGVSNFQLIKEDHKIASFFKKKSVAEQNSIVLAWEKLMSPRFAELRRCIYQEPSELDRFRQLVVNNVLATDIFDKELQTLRRNRWDKAFQKFVSNSNTTPEEDVNRKATIVMEHLIQASDVAHTMQHWHIYQKWNERLFAEMTLAYQQGRMDNNPADGWYQGELGFFDNYIIPLAKKLKECGVFGVSSDEYLNYALENRREWAGKGEEVVERYKSKYCGSQDGDNNGGGGGGETKEDGDKQA